MAQAAQETSLDRLKAFLNELFQYETQDLDFGVYKILGYKQREIKKFIDELLVDKIKEQLDTLTEKEVSEAVRLPTSGVLVKKNCRKWWCPIH